MVEVATKDLLTKENYKLRLQEIDLFLSINWVDDYIYEEKIEFKDKSKIKKKKKKKKNL